VPRTAVAGNASLQFGGYLSLSRNFNYSFLVLNLPEIRRRGSKDLLKVCVPVEGSEGTVEDGQPPPLQIYDVPYEGSGDSEKTMVTRPELDPRPAAEYELPWEWRKEHIVRTLSGTAELLSPRYHYLYPSNIKSFNPLSWIFIVVKVLLY